MPEQLNRSSKAGGVLAQWALAAYEFAPTATDERTPPADRASVRQVAVQRARAELAAAAAEVARLEEELRSGDAAPQAAPEPAAGGRDKFAAALGDAASFARGVREVASFPKPPHWVRVVAHAVCVALGKLPGKGGAKEEEECVGGSPPLSSPGACVAHHTALPHPLPPPTASGAFPAPSWQTRTFLTAWLLLTPQARPRCFPRCSPLLLTPTFPPLW